MAAHHRTQQQQDEELLRGWLRREMAHELRLMVTFAETDQGTSLIAKRDLVRFLLQYIKHRRLYTA